MRLRILVADDEALERQAIRRILEEARDAEVVEAENGFQALDRIRTQPVAAAFLDIKMPGLDGITAAETLRKEFPDVAVVFLTAYDQFGYARAALRLQVDDFLLKPASAPEVLAALDRVLARAATRDGERERSRAALGRLDSAVHLVADRLRHDLAEGLADPELVHRFLCLQGLEGGPVALLECRPPTGVPGLRHLVPMAESWFTDDSATAVAAATPAGLRVLVLGPGAGIPDLPERLRAFRDRVRTETGWTLRIGGAAASGPGVHPDALVAAAHRAASVARAEAPVMMVRLGGSEAAPAPGTETLPPAVTRTLEILEARMADDLSLNEVASEVGVSPSHLSRQLARATGSGFAECLALSRIAAAKRYLADGRLSVKEVAGLVGYHDPAYFARVFRRLEGRSPAEARP